MARPTEKTIKRLFAVSGNRCAFPGCTATLVIDGTVTGEICHIKAQSAGGPRYDPSQSDEERHGFDNLLLLCGDHHKVVDAAPETYTVEKLLEYKAQHEAGRTGGTEPSEEIVRRLLKQVVAPAKPAPAPPSLLGRLWRWLASCFVYLCVPLRRRYFQAYCDNLATEFHTLNLLGRRPLELEEIYIALRLSDHASPDLLPNPTRGDVGEQGEDLRRARRREQAMEVEAALSLSDRLAVLGDPGAGKTTLLKHLALRAARGDSKLAEAISKPRWRRRAKSPIPIFLTVNDLAREGHGLMEGITAALERRGFPYARPFVQRALARGHCLCLLDGLDEVVDDEAYTRLVREIDELLVARPGNHFLVTSRIAGFRYRFQGGFTLLELVEFDREQIRRFVKSWFADDLEEAEGLLAALAASPRMRLLAANPLLLSIIALIYERDTRLPERRVELYERCVWVLNEEWDRIRGLEDQRRFPPDFTLQALEALALRFQRDNHLICERDELLADLKGILPDASQADAFLDEVLARTGLLRQMSRTSYAFTHLTIQEFLVAQTIKKAGTVTEALNHLDDPRWREPIILLAGLQRDATALLQSILTALPDSLEALLLAVCCLTDADQTEKTLRTEVVERLITWLKTTDDYRLVRGVEDLADALDEATWAKLIGLLGDPDLKVRIRIAGLMGVIGDERVVPHLVEISRRDEYPQMRSAAIEALGLISFEAAMQALDEETCRFLTSCLTEDDPEVRRVVSKALRFAFVLIPAGEFLMGASGKDKDAANNEKPQHRVTLGPYYIARYPVTEAQYARFVMATNRELPEHRQGKVFSDETVDYPMKGVSWDAAVDYCKWLAGDMGQPIRLPTEAEWEKAARGMDARIYPWGNELPDEHRCNSEWTPVGQYSPHRDSPYGCADMAGMQEWTSSLMYSNIVTVLEQAVEGKIDYRGPETVYEGIKGYPYQADDGREDMAASGYRVVRGESSFRVTARNVLYDGFGSPLRGSVGFRVALAVMAK